MLDVSPPGAEPHLPDRDPAPGELSVHQQAGEGAAAADLRDQPAAGQEQVGNKNSERLKRPSTLHLKCKCTFSGGG